MFYLHLIQAGDHGDGVDVKGDKHIVKGGGSKHEEDHHESRGEKGDEVFVYFLSLSFCFLNCLQYQLIRLFTVINFLTFILILLI